MSKRDLEKDLEMFRNSNGGSNYTTYQFDGRMIAGHAIERAIQAESLVRELVGVIDELRRQINECGLDGEMWEVYQRAKEVLGDEN